ncbi:hypothetical protein [Gorillibacterium sp. sgz500922]|uniref:hypothetical protein n=1 Tax=Gorillibacterium sp. sgz500922 TaxID=3446694 RepID=UPI003F67EB03
MHDSIIENIEYLPYEKKVRIELEFCLWKQVYYNESEPEMQKGLLIFTGVDSFQIDPPSFMSDSNEILEVKIQDESGIVEIIVTDNGDVGKIDIVAFDVFWEVAS